jgi:hypothetical protein
VRRVREVEVGVRAGACPGEGAPCTREGLCADAGKREGGRARARARVGKGVGGVGVVREVREVRDGEVGERCGG